LIYSDGADNWAALTLGANRAILQSDGTDIAWGNNLYIDGTASISDTLYVENTFTVASGSNIHSGTLYVDAATNRVGIGGTNPDETLTIFSTGADQFQLYHNTNDAVFYTTYGDFVFDHGNVGINDSTPNALLEVAGTASISGGDFSVASSGWTSGDDYGPPLYVDVDTERVGIGTSNPGYKLDISGGDLNLDAGEAIAFGGSKRFSMDTTGAYTDILSSTTSLRFFDNNWSSELMTILNTGNVGIGDTDPGYKLSVDGTASVSGSLYVSDALNNVFVGHDAGYSNTTGTNNTFLGFDAGYLVATQSYNTLVGFEAGYNASGNYNTM